MNSMELFERRDDLKSVITDLRAELKNVAMKVNVGKKVTWDQDILRDTFNSMTPENAQHYAKLTYAVEERKYTTAPPAIKATLEAARTTEVGRFTVEVEDK